MASSDEIPSRVSFSKWRWQCSPNSACISRSTARRRKRARRRRRMSASMRFPPPLISDTKDAADGGGEFVPGGLFFGELAPARASKFVKFCAAIIFGSAPARFDPATPLKAVQRGIERALLDQQR